MPLYLVYGMTSEEYWDGDCYLAEVYRKKYRISCHIEESRQYALYCYLWDAVNKGLSNMNRKRGTQPQKAMENPIPLIELDAEEKRQKAERERRRAIAYLNSRMAKFKSKGGGE